MIQTVCDGCGQPIRTLVHLHLDTLGERVVSMAHLHDADEWDFHDLTCLGQWVKDRDR